MNKIKYGLKNVYYSVIQNAAGVISFGTPVALLGAVNLSTSPKGNKSEFYADDGPFFVGESNLGYEGNLEIALLSDAFKKDVLNYAEDANGILFEDADVQAEKIALMFEFQGDALATRHVFYNVSVSRPSIESEAKGEEITPQTDSFDITASPAEDTGYVKAKAKLGDTGYSTWNSAVYTYDAPTNTVDQATADFSKAVPADLVLDLTSSVANTVVNVKSNGVLVPGVQLSLSGIDVTIDDTYFSALDNGAYTISVELEKGAPVTCVVTVGA